jgi:hypothetical protein
MYYSPILTCLSIYRGLGNAGGNSTGIYYFILLFPSNPSSIFESIIEFCISYRTLYNFGQIGRVWKYTSTNKFIKSQILDIIKFVSSSLKIEIKYMQDRKTKFFLLSNKIICSN